MWTNRTKNGDDRGDVQGIRMPENGIDRWKTDHVMKTVYQHEMEMEEAKQEVADIFGTKFGTKNKKCSNR